MTNTNSWAVKRLDEVANVTMGQSPPSSSYNDVGQGVPFFQGKPSNIDNLGIASPYQYTTEPTKIVIAGTALMTVRAPVGEIFSTLQDICIGRGLSGIKANEDVSQRFLNYHLQYSTNQFHTLSQGTTFSAINSDDLKGIKVVLPPQSTQQKIADILSTLDQAIQRTDQIIQKTEVLKQGLMRELLTKGIGHKKFKKTKLGEIPEEWEVLEMREICSVRQGLQIAIKDRKTEPGDNRYLYLTNQYLKVLNKLEYVENPQKSVICNEDDVLMTRTGNTGVVVTGVKGVFHNNFFLIDYNRNRVNKGFLVYFLQCNMIQKMILDRAGSTTIPDLNHGDFYSLPFFCPQIEEQIQISDIIQLVDKKISVENKQLNKLLNLKKGLMQDIFSQKVQI